MQAKVWEMCIERKKCVCVLPGRAHTLVLEQGGASSLFLWVLEMVMMGK